MSGPRQWTEPPIPEDVTVVSTLDGSAVYDREDPLWRRRGLLSGMQVYLDDVDLFQYLGTVVEVTNR